MNPLLANFKKNWALWLVLLGLLLIIGWLGTKSWRLYRLSQNFQAHQTTAKSLLAGGMTELNPDTAVQLTHDLRRDVVALRDETAIFMPLTPYLTWLPRVGPLMGDAQNLMTMADAGTETAVLLVDAFAPALVIVQDDTLGAARLPQLVQVLSDAEPAVAQARLSLAQVAEARAALTITDEWPWTLRQLLETGDRYLPLAQEGLTMTQVAPALLGRDGLRTYLLLAQNEEEIRATGGFISGAGLLSLENGRILDVVFADAYQVDDYLNKPYAFPPEPFYDFMGLELFLFRDSNFWPDFPTSAEQLMTLYTYGQGTELDGIIAFDQRFMQLLIAVFGEVEVDELELILTAQNIRQQLREAWAAGDAEADADVQWLETRKSFMGPMAAALRLKVEQDLGSIDPRALLDLLAEGTGQKHLQIYMRDPDVALALAQAGWDGRLTAVPEQDILLVVDQNMGYNKVNALIEQTISYDITLADAGETTTAVVNVIYTHPGEDTGEPCNPSLPAYREGLQYATLVNRCYWNYQRIYSPPGSTLQNASQHPVPGEMLLTTRPWSGQAQASTGENGLTTFANFFLLERTSTLTTTYRYTIPTSAIISSQPDGTRRYTLALPKQAGAKPHPIQVVITLPHGTEMRHTTPTPTAVDGQTLVFETLLDENKRIIIDFE